MNEQPALFDDDASRAAKREGMKLVDEHADPTWKDRCDAAVEQVARTLPVFTPDDIWAVIEKPREPRALGPRMTSARKRGICTPTGRTVKSRIPVHHQTPIAEYKSLIYRET